MSCLLDTTSLYKTEILLQVAAKIVSRNIAFLYTQLSKLFRCHHIPRTVTSCTYIFHVFELRLYQRLYHNDYIEGIDVV